MSETTWTVHYEARAGEDRCLKIEVYEHPAGSWRFEVTDVCMDDADVDDEVGFLTSEQAMQAANQWISEKAPVYLRIMAREDLGEFERWKMWTLALDARGAAAEDGAGDVDAARDRGERRNLT